MRSANRTTRDWPPSPTRRYTFEEFCELVPDGQKADLIDGVIYVASPDNLDAGKLFLWLVFVIYGYLEKRDLGELFGSRIAFRLSDYNSPEPDLAFVLKKRLHLSRRGHFYGWPDLAIEIVSPDSVRRDYFDKLKLYEKYHVREYWIIDEIEHTVTVYRLDANGKYRQIHVRGGVLRSKVMKGFWLKTEWLWPETRPSGRHALAQILAAS